MGQALLLIWSLLRLKKLISQLATQKAQDALKVNKRSTYVKVFIFLFMATHYFSAIIVWIIIWPKENSIRYSKDSCEASLYFTCFYQILWVALLARVCVTVHMNLKFSRKRSEANRQLLQAFFFGDGIETDSEAQAVLEAEKRE